MSQTYSATQCPRCGAEVPYNQLPRHYNGNCVVLLFEPLDGDPEQMTLQPADHDPRGGVHG